MNRAAKTVLVVHPGADLFGPGRMVLESVRGLRETGFRVVAALPSAGPLDSELRDAGAEVQVVPMFVWSRRLLRPRGWPTLVSTWLLGLWTSWQLIDRERPDLLYISTITIPQWPLLARLRRVRTISHVHEATRSGSRWRNWLLYRPHIVSQRTLVNSQFSMETIRWALPALADRSEIVHNGVASPLHPTPPREPLEAPLRLLYMGRLSPQKGPDLALDAANLLEQRGRRTHITLLGIAAEEDDWFERELREQAADGEAGVEFAGFDRDVWPYLAEADVLLVPSRTDETFGNTVVEAILALRPVVVSDSSGLREAAGGYPTARLVTPGDSRAIADAVTDLVDHWPIIIAKLPESRRAALERHAPAVYRTKVSRACRVAMQIRSSEAGPERPFSPGDDAS